MHVLGVNQIMAGTVFAGNLGQNHMPGTRLSPVNKRSSEILLELED
jgi:hypothetical protein